MGRRNRGRRMKSTDGIGEIPFWGRLNIINEFFSKYEMLDRNSYYVINYHGNGGIGKSWLCRELSKEHKHRFQSSKNFLLDMEALNNSGDQVEVLSSLMMKFAENFEYKFLRFMYALCEYYKSRGLSNNGPELDRIQDNPFINSGLDILALAFPNIVTLGKTFETCIVKNEIEKIKREPMIEKLGGMTSEEIIGELVSIFVADLNENLKEEQTPVIVFLDTYEKTQNYISDKKSDRASEKWLYAPNGLFSNTKNIMWVIAGQKEISAKEYNAIWEDEKYCIYRKIDAFVFEQTKELLNRVHITEPAIVKKIWEESQGIPEVIKTCVIIYYSKENPMPSDFEGVSQSVVSRLIGGLAYEDKDIIDILSCMKKWKEADIIRQFPFISNDRYKKIVELSLIEKKSDIYTMNKNVQQIVFKECDNAILNYCVDYFTKTAADKRLSINEQKEYLKKKVKLQIEIIKNKGKIDAKSSFMQLCWDDILEYVRQNIYNVVIFDEIEQEINELLPFTNDKRFYIYKAYQYIISGNYVQTRLYLKEKALLDGYERLDRDTKTILYCVLTDAMDDDHMFYNDIMKQLIDKKLTNEELKVLSNHVNLLISQEKYSQAKVYMGNHLNLLDIMNDIEEPILKCMFLMENKRLLLNDSKVVEAEACLEIAEEIMKKLINADDEEVLFLYSDICNSFFKEFGKKNYIAKDIEILERIVNKPMKYKMRLCEDYKLNVGKQSTTEEFLYSLRNASSILKEHYLVKNSDIEKQLYEWVEETKLHYQKSQVLVYKWELSELGLWMASAILGDMFDVVYNRTIFLEYKAYTLLEKYRTVNLEPCFLEKAMEFVAEVEENVNSMWEHGGGELKPLEYWEYKKRIARLQEEIYAEKLNLAEAVNDIELMEYYCEKAAEAHAEYESWNNVIDEEPG